MRNSLSLVSPSSNGSCLPVLFHYHIKTDDQLLGLELTRIQFSGISLLEDRFASQKDKAPPFDVSITVTEPLDYATTGDPIFILRVDLLEIGAVGVILLLSAVLLVVF